VDVPTPLERAPMSLGNFTGREDLWLKREDVNELGMFKWRAALALPAKISGSSS
jgi:threonine dehydratase